MDTKELTKSQQYDVVIIGGGIVGAGIFRDLSLHGKSVLLLDKSDFNSQTSQGSSKMLHGGIRYLENLDFPLVFEALYEKNLWLKLAPHITKEIPFYLPVYKHSKWPLLFMKIGLFLYDLLSLFKNSPHKTLNKTKACEHLPGLNSNGLKGCGLYYDGIVDDHKLGLDCIYDGLSAPNSYALNYQEVIKINKDSELHEVTFIDVFEKKQQSVIAKSVVVALGPFTDQFMHKMDIPWKNMILPSKGVHLWLNKNCLKIKNAMVMQTKDNRVVFLIPQRNALLLGTTETPLNEKDDFKDIQADQAEIDYLLEQVNSYFPQANIQNKDIISSFAAVRPLVKDGHESSKVSRNHKVICPQENLYVIAGGKYTTFRKMAQDINKILFKKMNWNYDKKKTLNKLKKTSLVTNPFSQNITPELIDKIIKEEKVKTKEDLIHRRLSLQTLEHLGDEELIRYINSLEL